VKVLARCPSESLTFPQHSSCTGSEDLRIRSTVGRVADELNYFGEVPHGGNGKLVLRDMGTSALVQIVPYETFADFSGASVPPFSVHPSLYKQMFTGC
jgi:hypothetical protein